MAAKNSNLARKQTQHNKPKSKTNTTKKSSNSKKVKEQEIELSILSDYKEEIIFIIAFVIAIILILGMFGQGGVIGKIFNNILFGLFGSIAYTLPICLFFSIAFGIANQRNSKAKIKMLFGIILFCIIASFLQIILYGIEDDIIECFIMSAAYRNGGGLIGGAIIKLLGNLFGVIGTYVVLIALAIILFMMITGKFLVSNIMSNKQNILNHIKNIKFDIFEQSEDDYDDYNEDRLINKYNDKIEIEKEISKKPFITYKFPKENTDENNNETFKDTNNKKVPTDMNEVHPKNLDDLKPIKKDKIEENSSSIYEKELNNKFNKTTSSNIDEFENLKIYRAGSKQNNEDYIPVSIYEGIKDIPKEKNSVDKFNRLVHKLNFDKQENKNKLSETDLYNIIDNDFENEIKVKTRPQKKNVKYNETKKEQVNKSENLKFVDLDKLQDENYLPYEDAQMPDLKDIETFSKVNTNVIKDTNKFVDKKREVKSQTNNLKVQDIKSQTNNLKVQDIEIKSTKYIKPPIGLLSKSKNSSDFITDLELKETAKKLQLTLQSFGVGVTINNVSCGPTVTRYELQPEQGVKVSKITNLADDIKLNLAAEDIRIEAPIPGKAAVGIEVPNKAITTVCFRELIESSEFENHKSNIVFAVGKDIGGKIIVTDIAKMPHILIAGATGSGKSVCINTLIMSILYKANPNDVKLIMVDPKVVELSVYNGIPHLMIPVVTDPKKASSALNWAVSEMMERYQKFAKLNVRNIQAYNKKLEKMDMEYEKYSKMPQIVIIVDEFADLMMVAAGEVEEAVCRLAQLARAAGIHLVLATQRPSVNVITGLIKANIPSRIAFAVSSAIDSRTIIDSSGAEKLLGKGDMLFFPSGYSKPIRVQGAFVSDDDVNRVVEFLANQNIPNNIDSSIIEKITSEQSLANETTLNEKKSQYDEYFIDAGKYIIEKNKASIGMLQRVYKIGFNRAARIMEQLYSVGVVGEEEGTKPRKVLMSLEEFENFVNECL